jgi:hypothetical protein
MHAIQFMQTPLVERTVWWMDPDTHEIVARCELCGAEGRQSTTDTHAPFHFAHGPFCVAGLGASADERSAFMPNAATDARKGDQVSSAESDQETVLLVKRGLWEAVLDATGALFDNDLTHVRLAAALVRAQLTGEAVPNDQLIELEKFLAGYLDSRPAERDALDRFQSSPRPVPQPKGWETRDGDTPVIASKAMWDGFSAMMEATQDSALALAERLRDLVQDLEHGIVPARDTLKELRGALVETCDGLHDGKAEVRDLMGHLQWMQAE